MNERRPSELLMSELEAISVRATELGVRSEAADFDVGWTTDDLSRGTSPRIIFNAR